MRQKHSTPPLDRVGSCDTHFESLAGWPIIYGMALSVAEGWGHVCHSSTPTGLCPLRVTVIEDGFQPPLERQEIEAPIGLNIRSNNLKVGNRITCWIPSQVWNDGEDGFPTTTLPSASLGTKAGMTEKMDSRLPFDSFDRLRTASAQGALIEDGFPPSRERQKRRNDILSRDARIDRDYESLKLTLVSGSQKQE